MLATLALSPESPLPGSFRVQILRCIADSHDSPTISSNGSELPAIILRAFPIFDTSILLQALRILLNLSALATVADRILSLYTIKPFIDLTTVYYQDPSLCQHLQYLFYSLSRCNRREFFNDFLAIFFFLLDRLLIPKTIWILWSIRNLIFDCETAAGVLASPVFAFVRAGLASPDSAIGHPCLSVISHCAFFLDIDFGLDCLFPLVCAPEPEIAVLAARTLANAFADGAAAQRLLAGGVIAFLTVGLQLAAFEVKVELVWAVANAVRTAVAEGLRCVVEQGGLEILAEGLMLGDADAQLRAVEALLCLLACDIGVADFCGREIERDTVQELCESESAILAEAAARLREQLQPVIF
jgi:hypothetical protein